MPTKTLESDAEPTTAGPEEKPDGGDGHATEKDQPAVVAPADQKPPATPAAKPFNFERMKDEDLHEHRSLKQREE